MVDRLDPASYRRAVIRALAAAPALPLGAWLGFALGLRLSDRLAGIAVFSVIGMTILGLTAVTLATIRLHHATISRERDALGEREPKLHPPLQGPWMFGRFPAAGTTRARAASALPVAAGLLLLVTSAVLAGLPVWPMMLLLAVPTVAALVAIAPLMRAQRSSSASQ